MKSILNIADQGNTILVIAGLTKCLFHLLLHKYIQTYILIIERHRWQSRAKYLCFGELSFSTQIKSMENSRNMEFAYNVA